MGRHDKHCGLHKPDDTAYTAHDGNYCGCGSQRPHRTGEGHSGGHHAYEPAYTAHDRDHGGRHNQPDRYQLYLRRGQIPGMPVQQHLRIHGRGLQVKYGV